MNGTVAAIILGVKIHAVLTLAYTLFYLWEVQHRKNNHNITKRSELSVYLSQLEGMNVPVWLVELFMVITSYFVFLMNFGYIKRIYMWVYSRIRK